MAFVAGNDESSGTSHLIERANARRKYGVELQQEDEGDAHIRVDNAQRCADRIEHLIDDDATLMCGTKCCSHLAFYQPCSPCIAHTSQKHQTKQEQVEPINDHCAAQGDVFS